jgi:cytochrome P450
VTLPPWLPLKRNRVYRNVLAALDQKMAERIRERRRQPQGEFNLLSELVAFRDRSGKALRDEQISDHTLPTFLAAYEPTANSITAVLYLLAKHPEYQRRIHDELDQVEWTPGASCTEQLPLTTLAIHETLRLFPSGWLISRQALARHTLPSGAVIKPGTDVYISPFVIHRDERYYDDPLAFRPERLEGRLQQYRAAGTYFPFGVGPQACLGEYLAKSIITTAVAGILKDYAISTGSETPLHVESMNLFTLQLNGPVPVVLRRRQMAQQAA